MPPAEAAALAFVWFFESLKTNHWVGDTTRRSRAPFLFTPPAHSRRTNLAGACSWRNG